MFFNILGKVEPRPLACAARHDQRAVRDAGSPGNTCGSVPDHALPRAAARCGARHRGGGNLRGDRWQERSAVDGWTAVYDQVDASRHLPASPRRSRDRRSAAPYRSTIDGFASRRCPVRCCSRSRRSRIAVRHAVYNLSQRAATFLDQPLCTTSDRFTGALSLASEKQQCLGFICVQVVDEATWETWR